MAEHLFPVGDDTIVPDGFTLVSVLEGHTDTVNRVAWSPHGHSLASTSDDKKIRIWGTWRNQDVTRILSGHKGGVISTGWSPNGAKLASVSRDGTVIVWDVFTGDPIRVISDRKYDICSDIAWHPNGKQIAICGDPLPKKNKKGALWVHDLEIWDKPYEWITTFPVKAICYSPDGKTILSLSYKGHQSYLNIHDTEAAACQSFWICDEPCFDIAWMPDSTMIAIASQDKTIRIWDVSQLKELYVLEGHSKEVHAVAFSPDKRLLASLSWDNTLRLWRSETWETVAILDQHAPMSINSVFPGLEFHPFDPLITCPCDKGRVIRVWKLDYDILLRQPAQKKAVFYTTSKIALVGDSGVGKSGLGYRIAEKKFQITESTHGQQFWVVDELGKTRSDRTQCEAVLWDFAGQPDFRPVHALFLDDIDLALVLFDPSRQDTFSGVDYWLKQLSFKGDMCKTVLVAARTDVSKLFISQAELDAYCKEHNIAGGFIATSAKKNIGVEELLEIIRSQINWEIKSATVTTETFKRIKDFVLTLKADANRKTVLVSPTELRHLLEETDADWVFTDVEMMTAVGHLQNHGYVTILRRSAEELSILLAPDLLINLAASFMLRAQANERGLGSLEEGRVLRNDYRLQEVENLSQSERNILLNAVTELFLQRNICFRESVDNQTFLIFPSLIRDLPPRMVEDTNLVEDMSYVVSGSIENVYAALVVLMGYSPSFQRSNQWRRQAEYKMARDGYTCVFKQVNDDPGELQLVLYYSSDIPEFAHSRFQGLFEEILYTRNVNIKRYPPVICPHCGYHQQRAEVIRRSNENREFMGCADCLEKIPLPKISERVVLSRETRTGVERDRTIAQMRTTYEPCVVSVKSYVRDNRGGKQPSVFVSYAWGNKEHEKLVEQIAQDLSNAGLDVMLDRWDAPPGTDIMRFMSQIEDGYAVNYVLPVGSPLYREKYENKNEKTGSAVAFEVNVINTRLTRGTKTERESIIPLLVEGNDREALPPSMRHLIYSDFRSEQFYFVNIFDLILTLHKIPLHDASVRDLRDKLRAEAEAFKKSN